MSSNIHSGKSNSANISSIEKASALVSFLIFIFAKSSEMGLFPLSCIIAPSTPEGDLIMQELYDHLHIVFSEQKELVQEIIRSLAQLRALATQGSESGRVEKFVEEQLALLVKYRAVSDYCNGKNPETFRAVLSSFLEK